MNPRGIRNNNPLNIVKTKDNWLGARTEQTDPHFVQFCSMQYGARAACIILKKYITKHKCSTLEKIIKRWCPDSTADSYIAHVCARTKFTPATRIDWKDKHQVCFLLWAMAAVECGQLVSMQHFENGYALAFLQKETRDRSAADPSID